MMAWEYWFWLGLLALMFGIDFLISRNQPRISVLKYLREKILA